MKMQQALEATADLACIPSKNIKASSAMKQSHPSSVDGGSMPIRPIVFVRHTYSD
jgi:hypothetical protein